MQEISFSSTAIIRRVLDHWKNNGKYLLKRSRSSNALEPEPFLNTGESLAPAIQGGIPD